MKKNVRFSGVPAFMLFTLVFLLTAASQPARAQEEPTLAKDSVRITVQTFEYGPKGHAPYSPAWVPQDVTYRVKGPVPDGTKFWVQFSLPTNKQWLRYSCDTHEYQNWWDMTCPGYYASQRDEKKSVAFTGLAGFELQMTNELQGTNVVLLQGKMKVVRYLPQGYPYSQYYVDEDWRVPIGYLYHGDRTLEIEMWFRGKPGEVQPYLFYQGKQVARGENCGGADYEPTATVWWSVRCEFFGEGSNDVVEKLSQASGEYEIKVLQQGKLTRTARFTVAEDGSFDNGIASANKLGSDKVIVPFKVTVDLAPWDHTAWKTGAFYGNPLSGFTAPP